MCNVSVAELCTGFRVANAGTCAGILRPPRLTCFRELEHIIDDRVPFHISGLFPYLRFVVVFCCFDRFRLLFVNSAVLECICFCLFAFHFVCLHYGECPVLCLMQITESSRLIFYSLPAHIFIFFGRFLLLSRVPFLLSQGNHGIIASKRCDHLLVKDNISYDNDGSGIMLHKSCDDSIVSGTCRPPLYNMVEIQ